MSKRSPTGRTSVVNPELRNIDIPVRTETGRRLREVFAAKPGHVLVQTDYSAIEMRIMAEMLKRKP